MSKRHVPAVLHAELSEYSALLRALRTSDTLDLTSQLLRPPPDQSSQPPDADDAPLSDDDSAHPGPPPTESTSQHVTDLPSPAPSRSQSRSRSRSRPPSAKGKSKERDLWTRWPLLAGDVHVPEWGLIDEVKHAVEQVLKSSHSPTTSHTSSTAPAADIDENASPTLDDIPLPDDDYPTLSQAGLQALTVDAAAVLTRILGLLSAHVPIAEKSLQNRIRPMNWETVIDVASTNGAVSARLTEAVRARMSNLYGPATSNGIGKGRRASRKRSISLSDSDDEAAEIPSKRQRIEDD
ncbi:uncharacterized protein BXZ73DRAFT_78394 [Epithele typhae]|uniref:uncharacterized protein n=1 Tax=Epithele typhae TaxID=378194 RepID=UPI00200893D1|nr:uncharacterized protein BXZ73DRAFT_78394 [Epithele typhae]KAH9927933.1 hypothetical protein BXZ73DRAFT_78394 [Epithele typhae]